MEIRALPSRPPTPRALAPSSHPRWQGCIGFVSYGVRIAIRSDDSEFLDRLVDLLPPGHERCSAARVDRLYSVTRSRWAPCSRAPQSVEGRTRAYRVYAGSRPLVRSTNRDLALEVLGSDIQLTVADLARERLFVHAGVVAWRGRAILIPGRSFTGKTSLVAALLRAGAVYYSDEYAVFDGDGYVHPYPRPLSLRVATSEVRTRCPAESLGAGTGDAPLPVGLVVVTRYRPGARWSPRPLTAGRAALALLANTVSVRRQPEFALATLERAVSQARALRGPRPEAEEIVTTLLGLE
ncbi:MAG: hypothetical protein ACK47B_23100 [Armatimonadota bacterium]